MASLSSPNDLWYAFRQGDEAAFQQLYRLYAHDLLNYGYKVTNDVPLIEDSIHDLFIELWQSRANLSDTDSIKFYLFRSLRNKINKIRNRDLFFQAANLDSASLYAADDFVIENNLIELEEVDQLHRQLRKSYALLTPRQQEALNLRFYQHFSNEEIAQIMGVNYQSACRFIYSALKTLREVVRIFSLSLLWIELTRLL
ncbi:sigma-70 family RNA polymerase sigma factor [Spirosoma sp. HMF3257]|uniref:Sigma-70 family RNA polymerase sigma factor n=1 Tax=Spirosoma telluris TaxID=2183553 RepID=A0A327NJQ2_9BACT|nr:sigma-70 family RNA polymerase sigma factor [Spirosoma telluris]RAI75581.1 sigma-70 family RNA polymerase sigma factor [Spirosoma telluris]